MNDEARVSTFDRISKLSRSIRIFLRGQGPAIISMYDMWCLLIFPEYLKLVGQAYTTGSYICGKIAGENISWEDQAVMV